MDLSNRGQRVQVNSENNEAKQPSPTNHKKSKKLPKRDMLMKLFQVGLLAAVTVLIAGILLSIATYEKNREDNYVDTGKYQAVFLTGGQVYFGKIADLNKDNLVLSDIYYLRVDRQVQPDKSKQPQSSFTLAKLGCELHRPTDVMVVNKDQVIFWENLKDEGGNNTVAGAIKAYQASNNGEQNCDQINSNSSDSNSSTTTTDTNAAEDNTNTNNESNN